MRRVFAFVFAFTVGCAQGAANDSTPTTEGVHDASTADVLGDATTSDSTKPDVSSGEGGPIFDAFDESPCTSGATHDCKTTCGTAGSATCASGEWGSCKPTSPSDPCTGLDCTGKGDGLEHTYYKDADGDGHGDAKSTVQSCAPPPSGYATSNDDCDDTKAAVHPGATEICDHLDDDCNGQIDEGLHIAIFDLNYTDVPPCTTTDHASCKVGAHDWCRAKDPACWDGGFGPVELGATDGQFVCISGATLTGTWAAVTAAQPACSDDSMAGLRVCESAVHRAGAGGGYASAILQQHAPGDWKYLGLDPARTHVYGSIGWPEITGYHSGCTIDRVDTWDCNAAVERDCQARGHAAGFGPVEYNTSDLAFVCLDK